jgi:hypothetical protein
VYILQKGGLSIMIGTTGQLLASYNGGTYIIGERDGDGNMRDNYRNSIGLVKSGNQLKTYFY